MCSIAISTRQTCLKHLSISPERLCASSSFLRVLRLEDNPSLSPAVIARYNTMYSGVFHHWSPEAYVNMDIRTTAGNVATEAVFARNQDYGNDLIWVRTKAAARPLCYPYQGKVISTSNRTGVTEDLNGQKIPFIALSSTSYGEPAGLFGISCGHKPPNIFIPGYSLVRGEVPDKETNDREYALSQRQRYLERKERDAKREAAMADAMGDKEAFADASRRVKRAQADYDNFIASTGRTKRSDRTQVYGYDRSMAGKTHSVQSNLHYIANDAKIKAISGLPKILNLPDERIPLTVEVNLPKIHGVVPRGADATEVYVMAGAGTSTPIKDLAKLYKQYPEYGPAAGWQKKSGTAYAEYYHYVVHWYENNGRVPPSEIKLKGAK